jgi:hypothetical protein
MQTAEIMPNTTHKIHPGKRDPSILNAGARWQPDIINGRSETNGMTLALDVERIRFTVADPAFLGHPAKDPRSGMQYSRFG